MHSVAPTTAGPVHRFDIVGDTGGDDISTDANCKCDTRIESIRFNAITAELQRAN